MIKGNAFNGFSYFAQGFRLIREPGLRLFVVIPLVLNLIVFAAFFYGLGALYSQAVAWMMSFLPDWLAFLDWILWIFYGALVLLIFAYGFVVVANLIGSPFYGYLSELTQKKLTGQPVQTDEGWSEILKSIPRSIGRELQKIVYYLPRALGLLILGLIPVVNLVVVVLWFVFSSWMMAIQYIDYPSDNNRQNFSQLRQYLSDRRMTSLGFGLLAYICSLVPLLNLISVPASVCGATAFWVKENAIE